MNPLPPETDQGDRSSSFGLCQAEDLVYDAGILMETVRTHPALVVGPPGQDRMDVTVVVPKGDAEDLAGLLREIQQMAVRMEERYRAEHPDEDRDDPTYIQPTPGS